MSFVAVAVLSFAASATETIDAAAASVTDSEVRASDGERLAQMCVKHRARRLSTVQRRAATLSVDTAKGAAKLERLETRAVELASDAEQCLQWEDAPVDVMTLPSFQVSEAFAFYPAG